MKAFTVQPMLTPPEKNVDVNGIFEMTKDLFMSFGTIFWDDISIFWDENLL